MTTENGYNPLQVEWLDRRMNRLPFFTLAGTDALYREATKAIGIDYPQAWLPKSDFGAVTHFYKNAEGQSVCIVGIDILKHLKETEDQVIVLAMLVHEAAHIVEDFFETIGEHTPASEQRAYAMQYASEELFHEYRRQKEALTGRASGKA